MNLLTLVDGRKGEDDILVLLRCHDEPLTFAELLFILGEYFKSEDSYYPRKQGFAGSRYLLDAILDVYHGATVPEVCRKYQLELKLNTIDRRRPKPIKPNKPNNKPKRVIHNLAEMLE